MIQDLLKFWSPNVALIKIVYYKNKLKITLGASCSWNKNNLSHAWEKVKVTSDRHCQVWKKDWIIHIENLFAGSGLQFHNSAASHYKPLKKLLIRNNQ